MSGYSDKSINKRTKIIIVILFFILLIFLTRLLIIKYIFESPFKGTADTKFYSESLETSLSKDQVKEYLQFLFFDSGV